jgi:hypothetical protein
MGQFQKSAVIGIMGVGMAAAGCAKHDPTTEPVTPTAVTVNQGDKTKEAEQSFHDYSIPLKLTEVSAEIVYKEGSRSGVINVPDGFSPRVFLEKIVSGGQTGVDRAALDFGLDNKIEVGGWCPKGRNAEDGVIDSRYPLKETEQAEVTWRTEFNARDSDGSLVLVENHLMRGTGYTRQMAIKHEKPYWIQPIDAPFDKEEFSRWLIANNIRVLNIGGPRESDQPGSVYDNARALLEKILD